MPVVTDIKKHKRSDSRYSVYLDGEYAFSMSDLDLSTSGLRVGQTLSDKTVEEHKNNSSKAKAYALALRYLSYRPRSVHEMRKYLIGKDVDGADVEPVIERLLKAGLLNDAEFAASWIRNRQAIKPRSKRMLELELREKGIASEDVAAALRELDPEDELGVLIAQMERKGRLSQYAQREKLIGYFARQGYAYELIKKALDIIEEKKAGQ